MTTKVVPGLSHMAELGFPASCVPVLGMAELQWSTLHSTTGFEVGPNVFVL